MAKIVTTNTVREQARKMQQFIQWESKKSGKNDKNAHN